MTSHFAEPSEALPEMLSISSEGGLLKQWKQLVTALFLHSVHYFLHFLEELQMD